jgi:hypothetical protein
MEIPSRDFDATMSMGTSLRDIIASQEFFDGSCCERCYYGEYNALLAALIDPIGHVEFV